MLFSYVCADLWGGNHEQYDVFGHIPGDRLLPGLAVGLFSRDKRDFFRDVDNGIHSCGADHLPAVDGFHRLGALPRFHRISGFLGFRLWMALDFKFSGL